MPPFRGFASSPCRKRGVGGRWGGQKDVLTAICGAKLDAELWPATVKATPAIKPTRLDQLYSTAGAMRKLELYLPDWRTGKLPP